MRKLAPSAIAMAALLCCAAVVEAQSGAFDVSSVKPSSPDAKLSQTTFDPGMISAHGVDLKQLIEWAYQVTTVQVTGGPDWMQSQFFDVEAKAEGQHSKAELMKMLQPVLADRFKLALHHESKELPVYVMTAVANHPKLQPSAGGPANMGVKFVGGEGKQATLELDGHAVSMQYLADYLSGNLDRMVIDRTGLNESYDFQAEVSVELGEVIDKRSILTSTLWDAIPQVGLKLASQKQPVDILVIDHAEAPSAN